MKILLWTWIPFLLANFSTVPVVLAGPIHLKQVAVADGSRVDLLFDGKIDKKQIKTEYFRDIVQVTLTDATVYPAKISNVSGSGSLKKVFANQ
ncbi:MAG: hypothetical protein AAB425_14165, partial [Bdellovibrionota bacterium]